ncbi:MAG: lipopolysaccharide kinase InaA family protein [Verrucomicrobiota bacterium]
MNVSLPTSEELAGFLLEVRAGGKPLARQRCGNAKAFSNTAACAPDEAVEIARLALRPPPGLTLYKFGSRSVVGSYPLSEETQAVFKYYYPKGFLKHLTHGIGGSRCMRSWIAGLAFRHAGLPTPAPLFIAEWRSAGGIWLGKSFLATHRAEGVDLFAWMTRHQADASQLSAMANRLREIFERMAHLRISHGDLKATNIIIADDGSPSFVDLDAMEFLSPPNRWPRRRERDVRLFYENWEKYPAAAEAFRNVISPA